ncbi:hypothetical protein PMI42_07738 [Bradyrhizobium sp. YR681]|uniref:hypothetical protein n=1 Tax=Bradyrhizobium sp. YR681 TaxID=1144344 RepID=UPI00026FA938|nr:hypothetical protein [Bradyrhizobium sp. YR681]EJN07580.1 hypothetical protein PMI42_07738 [Bradyrhizobium sp. YR681]
MFILIEKIAPTPRPQIFNDNDAQDALLLKLAEDQRWMEHIAAALAAKLKRIWHGDRFRSPCSVAPVGQREAASIELIGSIPIHSRD